MSVSEPIPLRDVFVVRSKGTAKAFRVEGSATAIRIPEGGGEESVIVDANGNTVVELRPPARLGYDHVELRLRNAVRNATYRLPELEAAVALRNGSGTGIGGAMGDFEVYAELRDEPWLVTDLNGDGVSDIVVVVYAGTGGSGSFRYLFPVVVDEAGHSSVGVPRHAGDRTDMRSLSKRGDTMVLDYVTHAEDSPLCCPTLHVLRSFRYRDGRLVDIL